MQKLEGSEDLRIRRTRKLIQQAFIECAAEKGFAALTVRDITERAMINRSTFYRHYLDKYDLLEQHMDEIYAMLEKSEDALDFDSPEIMLGIIDLLKHIQQFADFYRVMLSAKGDLIFAQRFHKKMEKRFLSCAYLVSPEREGRPDLLPPGLQFTLVASTVCGAILWWLEQEQPGSPEQLAGWLKQHIYSLLLS